MPPLAFGDDGVGGLAMLSEERRAETADSWYCCEYGESSYGGELANKFDVGREGDACGTISLICSG